MDVDEEPAEDFECTKRNYMVESVFTSMAINSNFFTDQTAQI